MFLMWRSHFKRLSKIFLCWKNGCSLPALSKSNFRFRGTSVTSDKTWMSVTFSGISVSFSRMVIISSVLWLAQSYFKNLPFLSNIHFLKAQNFTKITILNLYSILIWDQGQLRWQLFGEAQSQCSLRTTQHRPPIRNCLMKKYTLLEV